MPEPHEQQGGEEQPFHASTPDLTPNLTEERTYSDGRTYLVENELGREALELHIDHKHHAWNTQRANEQAEIHSDEYKLAHQGIGALENALEDSNPSNPDNLMERAVLTEAIKILEKRKETMVNGMADWGTKEVNSHNASNAALFKADRHFQANEEAYKNEAVNEARREGIDINYPGYTDQPEQTPPPSEVQDQQ